MYRIDIKRYKYPHCFRDNIERFVNWCNRMHAETIVHIIVENGWKTYAIVSVTDPVALLLEKQGLIENNN